MERSSDAAMRLNDSAQAPNSSPDSTGRRADRSPAAMAPAARLAAATGRSTRRAMAPAATAARATSTAPPTASACQSRVSAAVTSPAGK